MHKLRLLILPLITVAALALAVLPAVAQQVNWVPSGTGNWNQDSNWIDPVSGDSFVPDAQFNEVAHITNGGTAQVSDQPLDAAGVNVGPGAVQIQSGGTLNVVPGFSETGGNVSVAGSGMLSLASGGTLNAESVNASGTLSVASGGTLNTNTLNASGTLQLGSSANVNITDNLGLSGTLEAQLNGSFQPISVGGVANTGGVLNVQLVAAPAVGDSWNLVDAATVNGSFASITANLPPPTGSAFFTFAGPGGSNGNLLKLSVEQILVLSVNRTSGAATLGNVAGGVPVELDGYSIRSGIGSLDPGAFNSLESQGFGGFRAGNLTSAHLTELDPLGSSDLVGGTALELGDIFQPNPSEFQQDIDELVFEYTRPDGATFSGQVEYGGFGINNLVLQIDENTGEGFLVNESQFIFDIDGYAITSESGQLQTAGWNSLHDQQVGDWVASASSNANQLSELEPLGATTFEPGTRFDLGTIFNVGAGGGEDLPGADLQLRFVFPGELDVRQGAVVYDVRGGGPPPAGADFDKDGDVDGDDFLIWQSGFGQFDPAVNPATPNQGDADRDGDVDGDDFLSWQAQFGMGAAGTGVSSAAVPEPSCGSLLALGLAASVLLRTQRPRWLR